MAGRMISLTVGCRETDESKNTFELLSQITAELAMTHHYATISSFEPSDEDDGPVCEFDNHEDLYHDDNTLTKVWLVLRDQGVPTERAQNIINDLHNIGILIRERIPVSPVNAEGVAGVISADALPPAS